MINTDKEFFGQQEEERILYVVRPHPLAVNLRLIKYYSIAVIIFVALVTIGQLIFSLRDIFYLAGFILGIVIAVLGTRLARNDKKRNLSYITDRRIVRFEPTTFVATNIRTLSWDEVVKVKAFPSNVFWKQLAIGNVVIHARTTIRTTEDSEVGGVAADDIELKDVYYYRDLGNYIDKILFTYKKKPKEVAEIKPFVAKPKGQRY